MPAIIGGHLMSVEYYISLPAVPKALTILDYESNKKKAGLYHGISEPPNNHYEYYVYLPSNSSSDGSNLTFSDKPDAVTFKDCFKNPLVFTFFHGMLPSYREQESHIFCTCQNPMNEDALVTELEKLNEKNDLWRRQVLYEALDLILDDGEFVEIYTLSTNHVDFNYGPPASERVIELRHVLSLKNALHYPRNAAIYDTQSGYKLTIIKT